MIYFTMERDSRAPDLAEYFVPPTVCTQIAMPRNRYLAIRARNHQTSSHTAGLFRVRDTHVALEARAVGEKPPWSWRMPSRRLAKPKST